MSTKTVRRQKMKQKVSLKSRNSQVTAQNTLSSRSRAYVLYRPSDSSVRLFRNDSYTVVSAKSAKDLFHPLPPAHLLYGYISPRWQFCLAAHCFFSARPFFQSSPVRDFILPITMSSYVRWRLTQGSISRRHARPRTHVLSRKFCKSRVPSS